MPWIYLTIAGLFEIVWAFAMKQSEGFTRPVPTAITIIAMILSFALLSLSMKSLPLGTAYMIWTGIGAVGAFLVGVMVLGEPASMMRVAAAMLIVAGGGARNATLLAMLRERANVPVKTANEIGWTGDALEAQAFAFLAIRTLKGLPITFPSTTGVTSPMTGGVLIRP